MGLRDLFIAKPPVKRNEEVVTTGAEIPGVYTASADNGGEETTSGTPVFLTPQSLVTFPGASLAVLILWKTIGLIEPSWSTSTVLPIILALLIGALMYFISLTDGMTMKDKVLGAFLALLNACYIALFVIGVPLTFQQTQTPAPSPPVSDVAE